MLGLISGKELVRSTAYKFYFVVSPQNYLYIKVNKYVEMLSYGNYIKISTHVLR